MLAQLLRLTASARALCMALKKPWPKERILLRLMNSLSAGADSAARMALMQMTTSSSVSVRPDSDGCEVLNSLWEIGTYVPWVLAAAAAMAIRFG